MLKVNDIRNTIIEKYKNEDFVIDRTGVRTIEVIGESFVCDEDWIVRKPNYDYVERELEWYRSMSLFVDDIPGDTPKIWSDVSCKNGTINSNYGYLIWSGENHFQYQNVLEELINNPNSRRAVMIYNRPTMHTEFKKNGMNDFICTYANNFLIRDDKLISHYLMRSNDAVFGFCNDVHWALHVQAKLAADLGVEVGDLIWTCSNFHVYERHFKFIERLINEQVG